MEEEQPQRTRMIITKMRFSNFKSYYGVTELGPFHHSFTSIVGANGSGKSNVIDGLLFVFGRRARQIRQQKAADLIHRSTDHPNCREARVDVYLVNVDQNGDIIEGSGFIISRSVNKDGSSQYFIDGNQCKYDQVLLKMKERHFDLQNNRFLILQGEVERISLMPPRSKTGEEGLLEFLEDIIGTSQYIDDIEKGIVELEKLNDEVHEKTNRFRIVEKERHALVKDKDHAVEYLKKEYNVASLKDHLYRLKLQNLEEEEADVFNKRKEIEKEIESKNIDINNLEKSINDVNKEIDKKKSVANKAEKEFENEQHSVNSAKRKKARVDEEKKHNEKMLKRNEKEIADYKRKIQQEEIKQKHDEEKLKNVEKELSTDKSKISEMKTKIQQETKKLADTIAPIQKEINHLQEQISQPEEQIDQLNAEISTAEAEIEGKNAALQQLQEELNNNNELVAKLEQESNTAKERKNDATKVEKRNQKRKTELEEQISGGQMEIKKLTDDIHSKREQIQQLEQIIEAAENKKEIAQVIKHVQEAGIKGLKGRLGDLGTINKKYDVAITTSCGMLDHIVVETTDAAQKVVQLCRDKSLGRVSLIIMEQLKFKKDWKTSFVTPKNSQRLVDLIKCEKWAQDAFYFALRDTLVCDNMDIASPIAYGKPRQRVVTLKGELLDTVGTITGGGNIVMKGGMKRVALSKEERETLKTLRHEVDVLEKSVEELKTDLNKHLRELQELGNSNIEQLEQEFNQCQRRLNEAIELNKRRTKEMKVQQETFKKLQKNFVHLRQTKQEDINEIQEKNKEQFELLKQKNAELEKLEGIEIKALKVSVSDLESKCFRTSKEQQKLTTEIDSCKNKIDDWKKYLKETETQMELLQNKMEVVAQEVNKTKLKELKGVLDKAKSELKSLYGQRDNINEQLNTVQQQLNSQQELLNDITSANSALLQKRTTYQNHIKSCWKNLKDLLEIADIHSNDTQLTTLISVGAPNENIMQEDSVIDKYLGFTLNEMIENVQQMNDTKVLKKAIKTEEQHISKILDGVNLKIIGTYVRVDEDYNEKLSIVTEVSNRKEECKTSLEIMKKRRFDEFMSGLTEISFKLKEMYYLLTQGGVAELELVDTLNPFTEGVVFSVRPPKKAWKNITNLSGGEKTLSSLALIFALHHYNPTPIYVMDEIDAALDFRNVSIIAHYIKERTKDAQFTIISLRPEMFELADRLMGIYKVNDLSYSVVISPNAYTLNIN